MKKLFRTFLILILCASTSTLISCSSSDELTPPIASNDGGDGDEPPPVDPPPPGGGAETESPLSVGVITRILGVETLHGGGYCEIAVGSPAGTVKNCTVQVPELELHFSEILIRLRTDSTDSCQMISYRPYYYKRTNSAAYYPPLSPQAALPPDPDTNPGINCSGLAPNKACWGGMAPHLMATFPVANMLIFVPSRTTLSTTYSMAPIDSAIETQMHTSYRTNADVTNTLVDRANPYSGNGVDYAGGNQYYDHRFECRDKWATLMSRINLTIGDEDTPGVPGTPGEDVYYDWGN